jgi:hypothetical protein
VDKTERKHKKVIENYISGMNKRESYKKVYKCTDISAQNGATKLFNREDVKAELAKIFKNDADLSMKRITGTLKKDLNAKKQVLGAKNEIIELRDNDMRHKSRESLLKLHGAPGYTREANVQPAQTLNINIGKEDIGQLGSILADLKALKGQTPTDTPAQSGEVIDIVPDVGE